MKTRGEKLLLDRCLYLDPHQKLIGSLRPASKFFVSFSSCVIQLTDPQTNKQMDRVNMFVSARPNLGVLTQNV